ncbi:MAG: hypothetical protein FH748_15760 [Balneolaceae bacterium]|nr:hypothetical protein [Balneolaceae bacterium]
MLENKKLLQGLEGVTLLVFFTETGCSSCINNELKNINEYFGTFPKYIKFFYIGSIEEQQYKYYNKRLPIEALDINKNLLNGYVRLSNPVAMLVDPSGNIFELHKADTINHKLSNRFYKRIASFFNYLNCSKAS